MWYFLCIAVFSFVHSRHIHDRKGGKENCLLFQAYLLSFYAIRKMSPIKIRLAIFFDKRRIKKFLFIFCLFCFCYTASGAKYILPAQVCRCALVAILKFVDLRSDVCAEKKLGDSKLLLTDHVLGVEFFRLLLLMFIY